MIAPFKDNHAKTNSALSLSLRPKGYADHMEHGTCHVSSPKAMLYGVR